MTVLAAATVLSLVSGYTDWDANKAVWVIGRESGNNTTAYNPAGPYVGLMQIATSHGYTREQLEDPAFNIKAGHDLYLQAGWTPWPVASQYKEEPMATRKVVDFSNYTGPRPDVAALKADGWAGAMIGTQNPAITRQQVAHCRDNDFAVDALYVFVYWDAEDFRRLSEAVQLASELSLPVWLDCEWHRTGYPGTAGTPPPERLVDMIKQYRAQLGQYYAGIYTGAWWWPPYTGNNREFAQDRLWHADYQGVAPDFDTFRPYGGWLRPTLWQYSSGGAVGVNCDLNVQEYVVQVIPLGIGVHYRDGTDEEVWNAASTDKVIDGVGMRYSNGEIQRLWPQ